MFRNLKKTLDKPERVWYDWFRFQNIGGEHMYNYDRLRGRIKEKGYTQETLCDAINMSQVSLSAKLNSKTAFTQRDIARICQALDICSSWIGAYFFTEIV